MIDPIRADARAAEPVAHAGPARRASTMIVSPARLVLAAVVVAIALGSCGSVVPGSSSAQPGAWATSSAGPSVGLAGGRFVIVGQIVTMDDPPVAEALFIDDGLVAAVGSRTEVLAIAGDGVPVIDIGDNVAYPGFIDAHAHWIGDRDYYHMGTPAQAIEAAATRGWTSISEQWVNPKRLDELTGLAARDALPLRVDAYLALNFHDEFLGDWYTTRTPGPVGDHLRVQGLKIHLDHGLGGEMNWDRRQLIETIGRADDAGWQVSVHAARTEAQGLLLDALEAALGQAGPNPLHHRVEHALQVTDEQLARYDAMDIAVVTHLDGAADWLLEDEFRPQFEQDLPEARLAWLARWRDFVDAGLHVASATDAPWTFPGFDLMPQMGRPLDHIAAGIDGRTRTAQAPPWLLDQKLTAEQALRSVTLDAAWAIRDEARRGHLAPGTLGDVTILSGDVTTATPDGMRAMKVVATIVGGVAAYCAEPALCSRLGA
ncbi:MAG TPA: amidohydrolase family protein [Candidatus Limnocylindrales bacterium]|nr:amidohydrolase family protein [Candidatus Limnocylindrales bacterium]